MTIRLRLGEQLFQFAFKGFAAAAVHHRHPERSEGSRAIVRDPSLRGIIAWKPFLRCSPLYFVILNAVKDLFQLHEILHCVQDDGENE